MGGFKKRYIADRSFYRYVIGIVLPIVIQNFISTFVNMLDNIMIGRVGTLQMSSVSIANQFIMIFNLCIFGAVAGAGIFTAQFHGNNDDEGIRYTFRFKLLVSAIIVTIASFLFSTFGKELISLYLRAEGNSAEDNAASMYYGSRYLQIMVFGLLPFAVTSSYSGTLRESEQTKIPMIAGVVAVFVNLVLNYILIFGHFGAPQMGVEGAALATVISRYVELSIVTIWTHTHKEANRFIVGAFRSLYIPGKLFKQIVLKGTPLLINETLFSIGLAIMSQCYSQRGLEVVAAINITNTIYHLCNVINMALGSAVGIIMGRMLGAGRSREEVLDTNRKLVFISLVSAMACGIVLVCLSGVFPVIYNTTDSVKNLATKLILINAIIMCAHAYINVTYFTMRSGGQTVVTFLFDSCFICVVSVPVAYLLSYKTNMSIVPMYASVQCLDFIKVILGIFMIKQGKWIQNLTINK